MTHSAQRQPDEIPDAVESAVQPAPCACCGDAAEVDAGVRKGKPFWQVICACCGRSGPREDTEIVAITSWDDIQFAIKDFK